MWSRNIGDHVRIVLDPFRLDPACGRIDHSVRGPDERNRIRIPNIEVPYRLFQRHIYYLGRLFSYKVGGTLEEIGTRRFRERRVA